MQTWLFGRTLESCDMLVINLLFRLLRIALIGTKVKICDSDDQFISDSYLLIISPFGIKNVSFNT